MKKHSLILCIFFILSLCACGAKDSPPETAPTYGPNSVCGEIVMPAATEPAPSITEAPLDEILVPALGDGPDCPVAVIRTDYYSLTLPHTWGNTCLYKIHPLDSGAYSLSIYEHTSFQEFGGGKLCTIMLIPTSEDWADFPNYTLNGILSTPDGDYQVVVLYPTDVQYTEKTMESYNTMYDQLSDILGTLEPAAGAELILP